MAQSDMLDDKVPEERGLSGAGFAYNIYVLALVLFGYAKALGTAPAFALSNDDAGFRFQDQPPLLRPWESPVSSDLRGHPRSGAGRVYGGTLAR